MNLSFLKGWLTMQGYLSLMALKRYVLLSRDENNLGKSNISR